jgi:hypothetical protein
MTPAIKFYIKQTKCLARLIKDIERAKRLALRKRK